MNQELKIIFSSIYLENIVTNIVDLNDGRITLAEFRVQHTLESGRSCD